MGDLIALFAVFCIFGLPVAAWMLSRVLRHRERMEMLRHGGAPGAYQSTPWAASAPIPPVPPPQRADGRGRNKCREEDPPDVALRKGVSLSMIGLALTIGLSFIDFDGTFHPGPWLLGGLVPLFFGLSSVLLAVLGGATIGRVQMGAPPPFPPPGGAVPPGPPPGSVTYDNSYTYRPGNQTELTRPGSPPDRR